MNKIFKVIFSKAKGCYVVVSELAKSAGKGTSVSHIQRGYKLTLAAAVLSMMMGMSPVGAAAPVDLGNNAKAAYDDKGNLTIGDAKTVAEGDNQKGWYNTTIGTQSDTLRNVKDDTEKKGQPLDGSNTILVDEEGKAHPLDLSTEAGGSTAVGYKNKAEGDNSTAIGNNAKISNKPVTYYVDAEGKKTASPENAVWYKDSSGNPTKVPQVFRDAGGNTTTTPQYVHTYTEKDPDTKEDVTKTEITSDATKADQKDGQPVYNYQPSDNTPYLYTVTLYQAASNSIAAGTHVTANGSNAVAVGYGSTADNSAVAIGDTAAAAGDNTIAIGTGSTATDTDGTGSIAIGKDVKANKTSTAVGLNGTKASSGSSAYGNNAVAEYSSSAFGSGVQASLGSYASGMAGTKYEEGHFVPVPITATNGSYATGMGGTSANNGGMAVGNHVSATNNSYATGMGGTSADGGGMAVGANVHAQYGGFAAGTNNTSASSGVAVGSNVHTYDGSSYAGGMNGTTAGNGSIAFGNNVHADTSGSGSAFAAGMNGTTADGSSVAVGDNVHAAGGSYAAGMGGTSASSSAVAIGNKAYAYGGSYAFGSSAHAESNSTAIGSSSTAKGGSYAFGSSADADNSSYAIGNSANARSNSMAIGSFAKSNVDGGIALGSNSTVYRGATAGLDPRNGQLSENTTPTWKSTYGALSIGVVDSDGTVKGTRQIIGVAAGTNDTDAVNVAQLKQVAQGFSIHDYSVNSTTTAADTNYNNVGATGRNALAAGVSASATGDNAVAIGYGAKAEGRSATAIGKNASATGQYAMAFGGLDTIDKKRHPVTFTNTASGASATAFGQGAQAKGAASLAFGRNTVAGVDGGSGQQSVAFGEDTQALGGRSLAFGEKTIAKYNDSVAFGNDTRASSTGATAFGNRTRALSSYSTAWGNATVAADEESTAWGTDTIAGAKLDANGAVTNIYTYKNNPDDKNEQAKTATEQMDVHGNLAYIQPNGKTAGIKQMKIDSGSELHDYVVLAGKDRNTYVRDYQGSLWKVNVDANGTVTVDTTAGTNGKVYNGKNGAKQSLATTTVNGAEVAITPDNVLTKAHEGSNGYNIDGYANATAFGYSTEASGDNATAFGNDTKASAAGATAFGYQTLASGENSTAFGENSIAAAKNSLAALGGTVAESATNAAAIGNGAQAKLADSVALGSGALANRSGSSKGYDVLTGNATTEASAAWVANANAIAIGNDTEGSLLTRQITGVAAGSLDTDAVNVAQLKAAGLGFTTNTKDASNTTDNYKGYKVVSRKLGDTIAIKASDETDNHSYSTKNLTTRIAENGDISILMDENPAFTSVTTSDVIFAGNPHLTDKDGKAAKADTNVHYGAKTLTDSQNITTSGNDPAATRLHYKDEQGHTYELATMDDGQIYAGDIKNDGTPDTTGFGRRMNEKTTINGGVTDKDKLTDGNIGVVSNGTDTLTVKLAKDLKDLNSVTTGKTVMDDSGIKITNNVADETKNVVINGDKISYGGNQVTNMGSGSDGTADGKPTYNTNTNGANIGDVKNIASSTTDAAKLTGDSNITVTYNDPTADGKNTVKLNDSITLGSDADKKVTIDGTAGTITAGDKVSLDGGTGTGSIGGVTIGNQTGVTTTKMDGDKAKTEDGTFVTGLTNTTWDPDTNGIVSGRAATEDQLKAVSDTVNAGWELDVNGGKQKDVTPTSRKVNFKQGQNITISGSGDDVTVATADNVRFASVRVGGDADGKGGYTGGIVIGQQSGLKADGKPSANPNVDYYITGLKNTNWDSEKIQSGRAATEDQLKLVADEIKNGTVAGDVFVTGGGIKYNGEHDASDTTSVNNGKGSLKLTLKNQDEPLSIDGLHDYYATSGTVSADGKTLTIARNEKDAEGKPVTFDVDLTNLLNKEKHLIANPADGSQGVYKVNEQGEVTLQVQDAAGNNTPVTISGLDGVKGLNFDANTKKTSDGKVHNVKLGGTIKVQGVDPVTGHDYSADNVTTEVDDNGNITIKLDKALTADTVMVNGKDGRDGQIGLNGKDGKDGTVTTIIRTIGKNGTDGTDGKPGVNGTDGITRIVYQDGKDGEPGTTTHTVATLDDGLKFGANHPVVENGANPVGNKLNSTIDIKGAGTKSLDQYSGKNLVTSVEQDAAGTTTIHVLMDKNISADGVTVGQAGKDGVDGLAGTIGINGKNGVAGTDGKQGITTTIIRTEKGQPGKAGVNGKPGVDGTDITRIVYQNSQDGTDGRDTHTVATLDDGLKFAGDDGQNDASKVITKKLNERLDIVGKAQGDLTYANIGVTKDDAGQLYIRLAKHVDLDEGGTLKAGDATIGAFSNTDLTTNKKNHPVGGSYVTGLSNTDWNVSDPEYVSGRAATEDQLDKISKAINNAATAAGKRTVVTVNDKSNPATADPGANAYGEYNTQNGNLMIAAMRDSDGAMTYNIKLNDQLAIGQKDEPGVAGKGGKDGKVTVETKGGTTVIIGHDGQDGEDGKDGISVIGKDGQNGVSIIGSNGLEGKDGIDGKISIGTPGKDGQPGKDAVSISGQNGEGHIGLTGPAGKDGKDASADIHVKNGQVGVDGTDGNNGKDGMDRIVYDDHNGKPHEVATMDDGMKFVGNDGKEVSRKLNTTLSIKGGITNADALQNASTKNLGVRSNAKGDGLEIVMTDTPDFTKVTVGEGNDTTKKITIGKQTVTGKKSDGSDGAAQTGNYITGLDNKAWDKDNVVENRAATEGQLKDAIQQISGKAQGGFGLTADDGQSVKQDLGSTITVTGDTNIQTQVSDGKLQVGLKKDVDLGKEGSVKAGNTTIDKDGVDTNKVKVGGITITDQGIDGGSKQITDIASGASEIRDDGKGNKTYVYNTDTNAANIGDVKRIAGEVKNEVTNVTKNVTDVTNKVNQMGDQVTTVTKDVTQLKQDVKADRTYQGDDGAAKKVKVKFGSFLSLTGGAQLADLTEEGNIGVVQKEIDDPDHKDAKITGLSVRLAKHLNLEKTTYTSEENGQTYTSEIDGKGLTIKTGDANRNITVQDGNVNMGGNQIHHVAPGQAPDDAVNVSQLNATNYAVNKLDTRVNRVGANAAALAALHPLDFDPDDKWDFSAGYGHYKDANAAAVGAFYRPNEDTMFSVGGSFGGGENMVNAGISVKLGQGNHVSTSRVAMAKEIKDLKKDVAALKAVVNQQSALIDKLTGVNAGELSGSDDLFPDVPANHWAYEYVTRLKQAGILTGYPDGNFAGDRMMTRYEFAAIVYRAIMAGAAANPSLNKDGTLDRLAREFSSEMKYIRIDTIRKDRNGRPTIQRVRVIKEDEKEK